MLICHRIDLSTSPQACSARWLVQYLDFQTGRLGDQSPSIQCSVVGAVPRSLNWQTGRPIPEHIVLGGRCSPQISKLADWATSPRAYSARWSVQSPNLYTRKNGRPVPEHTVLGDRCSSQERLIHHQFLSVILKNVSSHK